MNVNLTEKQVSEKLIATAKVAGITAPRCTVMNRMMGKNSLTRTVRFALIVPINQESLIDALIAEALQDENEYSFVGSEVNLQQDMEIEYLYFDAKIMSKTK